jgi:hypothetical protein
LARKADRFPDRVVTPLRCIPEKDGKRHGGGSTASQYCILMRAIHSAAGWDLPALPTP